jgi:16S rRNA processing protein RimM
MPDYMTGILPKAFVHMGTLARPHGIKGDICIDWYADAPLSLFLPDTLWLQEGESAPRRVTVVACRPHKGRQLLRLEGIDDRTAAEALRGHKLLVDRARLPELPEDEAYINDLLGYAVHTPDGQRIGRLERVECAAGQDIWVIATPQGTEVLFPAQPCFIAGFDVLERTVRIDPPEGLLDICRS